MESKSQPIRDIRKPEETYPNLSALPEEATAGTKALVPHGFHEKEIRHLGQESPGRAEFAVVRLLCINPEGFSFHSLCDQLPSVEITVPPELLWL
ncbi:hypothetical protein E5288_WYG014190 [Bos mutus]|uniref:Uncharacterized protein n=1 Tax=Bos mutus TaxID=72004 RepID=A0A6B0R9Z3_9CETA|nr:hypothetical protein [Bos mutus]